MMQQLLVLSGFLAVSLLVQISPVAWAGGACTICLENATDEEIGHHKAYACSQHHCIDGECLAYQVRSLEIHSIQDVQDLESKGVSCCGDEGKCKERVSLATIRDLLEPHEKSALDERLMKIITASKKTGFDERAKRDIYRLREGIAESFNLCCPAEGCGGTLDKIEGCNAATCSERECKTTFCYLCLKPQKDSRATHLHAQEHSGDYWEHRKGYPERYHWLLARKTLSVFFRGKVDGAVRKAALDSQRALLEEKNMWPLPAGLKSVEWVRDVRETPQSTRKYYGLGGKDGKERIEKTELIHTPEKKIEILQNEYIYRHHEGDEKNAAVIKAELEKLGGKVLVSLDIRDAGGDGQHHQADGENGGQARVRGAVPAAPAERLEPMLDGHQVNPAFAALGGMYQVGNVIWSGVAKEWQWRGMFNLLVVNKMNQHSAGQFCQNLGGGARLPTLEEYEALRRAMGYPIDYRSDRIADMAGHWFWSSSDRPRPQFADHFFNFIGDNGIIFSEHRNSPDGSARCVRVR